MKAHETLQQIISESRPYARFDKAQLYRTLDVETIAYKTANTIVGLIDEPRQIQSIALSIGRKVLMPFDNANDLEHESNRNYIACGLSIVRALLNYQILEKRFEKVVEGKNEDGTNKYKTINIGGKWITVKVWNLYICNTEFVDELFTLMPIKDTDKSGPCYFQPKKRTSFFDPIGGHLVTKLNKKYLDKFTRKQIPMVYDHINKLQSLEWRVNTDVYDVIDSLKHLRKFSDNGQRRDFSMTMANAKAKLDKHFYFYWFLGRRGRYYCASSYLTPQGGKVSKGLLYFNKKSRLGSDGLFWLLVNAANTCGHTKVSIDDRYDVALGCLEMLLFIGNNPEVSYPYWSKTEEPEPFLATCIEIAKAYSLDNPEDFESGLPCGIDATCSGIQIMSYLTRDEVTGRLVNLTDDETIGDVYNFAADKVDWDSHPFWSKHKAKKRSLMKRPIMTCAYSAGAKTIAKALMNDWKHKLRGITEEDCEWLAKQAVRVFYNELKGPGMVMQLLQDIAKELAERNQLFYCRGIYNNFPFIESRTIPEKDRITFKIKGENNIKLYYVSKESGQIDTLGVHTGISPDFIHHCDSQLMAFMIDRASDYVMAPTHDCVYTSPAHVGKMYEDIRVGFHYLYGTRDYLQEVCDSLKVNNTAKYGKLNVSNVLDNIYCFS